VSQPPSASCMFCAKHTGDTMPKGPNGEKRPADAVGLAVLTGKIATGEVEDVAPDDGKDLAAKAMGKKGMVASIMVAAIPALKKDNSN
jgi:hypothetical protein